MGVRRLISKVLGRDKKERSQHEKQANDGEHISKNPASANQPPNDDSAGIPGLAQTKGSSQAGGSTRQPPNNPQQQLEATSSANPDQVVKPSEDLQFGDGSPPANTVTGHAESMAASSDKMDSGEDNNGPTPMTLDAAGNDGGGFSATAQSSSQTSMGNQHLTYSGSVQYDYTGGHGQGAFASAGSHGSAAFGY